MLKIHRRATHHRNYSFNTQHLRDPLHLTILEVCSPIRITQCLAAFNLVAFNRQEKPACLPFYLSPERGSRRRNEAWAQSSMRSAFYKFHLDRLLWFDPHGFSHYVLCHCVLVSTLLFRQVCEWHLWRPEVLEAIKDCASVKSIEPRNKPFDKVKCSVISGPISHLALFFPASD
jgi:hypothetical protein